MLLPAKKQYFSCLVNIKGKMDSPYVSETMLVKVSVLLRQGFGRREKFCTLEEKWL